MAHTFGSTVLSRTSAATSPITRSATTVAGDTVLVLFLKVVGATDRAGGAPTFNGVAGAQANSTQKAAASPEAGVEVWYWDRATISIGTADISIPNTGSLTIFSSAYTGQAASGYLSQFDAANGTNATSANPTTNAIVSSVNGAIYFAATAGGWQSFGPSGRTGTSLFETDDGAHGGGGQYLLQATAGSQAMSWTFGTSDDWGAVGVAFKEVPAPILPQGTLSIAGTVTAVALGVGLAAGAIGLSGPAPSLFGEGPNYATPSQAALQFKGPAQPPATALFTPAAANLSASGTVTSLSLTSLMTPGTLSVSSEAPGIAWTCYPGVGQLAVTGLAPERQTTESVAVPSGALTLAGLAPNNQFDFVLAIGAGAIVGSGQVPALLEGAGLSVDQGVLVLSGTVPVLDFRLEAPQGQIALTGSGTVLGLGVSITNAALALSGQNTGVDFGFGLASGLLTLAGEAPAVVGQVFISPDTGAISLSGLAPTPGGEVFIATPVGQLILEGKLPSTGGEVYIESGLGALSLAGSAPAAGFGVSVAQSQLSFAGQEPGVDLGVPVGLAATSFTGYAPALSLGGQSQTVSPAPAVLLFRGPQGFSFTKNIASAQLNIAGPAPIAVERYITIGQGALSLSGQFVGIAFGGPLPASLVLTGHVPTVMSASIGIQIGAGSLALTGNAPALATTFATPVGSLVLNGLVPAPGLSVPVSAGQFALTGTTATVNATSGVIVPVGALAFAGLAPTVATSLGIEIPKGTLTFTGRTPLVIDGNEGGFGTPTASLVFTGRVPTLHIVLNAFDVGVGVLSLTGPAPTSRIDEFVSPASAATVLQGVAPSLQFSYSFSIPTGSLAVYGPAPSVAAINIPLGFLSRAGSQRLIGSSLVVSSSEPGESTVVAIPTVGGAI